MTMVWQGLIANIWNDKGLLSSEKTLLAVEKNIVSPMYISP